MRAVFKINSIKRPTTKQKIKLNKNSFTPNKKSEPDWSIKRPTCFWSFLAVLICSRLLATFCWVVKILKYRKTIRKSGMKNEPECEIEMFYLNTIEQLFLFVELLFQLEVCLPYSRLLAAIPILAVFQNLRWNSNKTPLLH